MLYSKYFIFFEKVIDYPIQDGFTEFTELPKNVNGSVCATLFWKFFCCCLLCCFRNIQCW